MLAALIWGAAFTAQSVGMDYVGPFTFNCVRSLIGAVSLLPVALMFNRKKPHDIAQTTDNTAKPTNKTNHQGKTLIIAGITCGAALFVSSSLQQVGIVYTTTGKAGFITALYIIIVPILGLFFKRKVSPIVWLSAVVAVAGLYLMCINEGLAVNIGDMLTLLCALGFSIHILMIAHFSPRVDAVKLACTQFFVCSVLSAIPMFLLEKPDFGFILAAWLPLLYAGVLSCGVAYTLQIIGQRDSDPTIASLIMSLESVFAALVGWLVLGEMLSTKEFIGCALVFAAVVLTNLPFRKTAP